MTQTISPDTRALQLAIKLEHKNASLAARLRSLVGSGDEIRLLAEVAKAEAYLEFKVAGTNPEPFSTSRTSNWVARAGGLPTLFQHVAHDLLESGQAKDESEAIHMAVGIVHNWAEGHDGHGNKVKPETQAEAAAAIAEWDQKRAATRAGKT